jgi:hypothetical protein
MARAAIDDARSIPPVTALKSSMPGLARYAVGSLLDMQPIVAGIENKTTSSTRAKAAMC